MCYSCKFFFCYFALLFFSFFIKKTKPSKISKDDIVQVHKQLDKRTTHFLSFYYLQGAVVSVTPEKVEKLDPILNFVFGQGRGEMEISGQSKPQPVNVKVVKPIEATPESFKEYGQVMEASPDWEEFGPKDAQLNLSQGVPR